MGKKNDDDVKPKVIEFFEKRNFLVTPISEGNSESADLLVKAEDFTCLVEIKEKLDSYERTEVSEGVVIVEAERIERKKKYSRLVDKAISQLTDSTMPKVDFKVMWFEFQNGDIQTHIHQVLHSLFGIRLGVPVPQGQPRLVYFCTDSDFWKHRATLSGVFISLKGTVVLAVNPNHEALKDFLEFTRHVKTELFGHDLISAESRGEVFIADFDIDRKFDTEISKSLAEKYGYDEMFLLALSKIGIRV